MNEEVSPDVVYYRVRPADPEASEAALRQQREDISEGLGSDASHRYEFTEIETAEPDYGWTEERPELQKACEKAVTLSRQYGFCMFHFATMDPIGNGDALNEEPRWARDKLAEGRVSIAHYRWAAFEAQLDSEEDFLSEDAPAEASEERYARPAWTKNIPAPPDAPEGLSVFVDLNYAKRAAPFYLCNRTNETVTGRLICDRPYYTVNSRFQLGPGRCKNIDCFVQGRAWQGEPLIWKFEFRGSRAGEVKWLVVTGERFKKRWRELVDRLPESGAADAL